MSPVRKEYNCTLLMDGHDTNKILFGYWNTESKKTFILFPNNNEIKVLNKIYTLTEMFSIVRYYYPEIKSIGVTELRDWHRILVRKLKKKQNLSDHTYQNYTLIKGRLTNDKESKMNNLERKYIKDKLESLQEQINKLEDQVQYLKDNPTPGPTGSMGPRGFDGFHGADGRDAPGA